MGLRIWNYGEPGDFLIDARGYIIERDEDYSRAHTGLIRLFYGLNSLYSL